MAFPAQIDSAGAGAHNCLTQFDGSGSVGFPGAFSDGSGGLYVILGDLVAFRLRCYRSTDGGNGFAEQDAANAPAMANDIGAPNPPGAFEYWTSCFDVANKIIYTAFFDPVGFKLAIKPFKIGVGWQAAVISTLSLAAVLTNNGSGNLGCEYRPNDNSIWVVLPTFVAGDVAGEKIVGARLALPGTWDAAFTLLAGSSGDNLQWNLGGIRRDSVGNIRYIVTNVSTLPANSTSALVGGVIHADNSLAPLQTIKSTTIAGPSFDLVSIPWISSANRITFCFLWGSRGIVAPGSHNIYVARALGTNDTPAWMLETPNPIQLPFGFGGGGLNYLKGTITDNSGVDYVFYNYYTAGGNLATFAYIADQGNGWGSEQLIGTIDTSGAGTYIGAGVCIPSVIGSWGLVFQLTPTVPGTFGMGFAAGVGLASVAPQVIKQPLLAIIPFPIKRCLTPHRAAEARPELIHCIQPSPDGRLYVPVKGPLINRECC
jgi:hypothetical protein